VVPLCGGFSQCMAAIFFFALIRLVNALCWQFGKKVCEGQRLAEKSK